VPHDVLVPGALTVCEMSDLAAALAPRPLWIGPLVDGVNRAVPVAIAHEHLRPVEAAYRDAEVNRRLSIAPAGLDPASPAEWIAEALAAPTR
jgi:hypothetical protein